MSDYFPIPALHPAGHAIIAVAGIATLALGALAWPLGAIGGLATLFCVYFFRDPDRVVPAREGLLVAPADGRVTAIAEIMPPAEWGLGDKPRTRITIFLSVFDVHVNRIAAAGKIARKIYHPGKFLHAGDKDSEHNERLALVIETPSGEDYAQVRIAGLLARRILCYAQEGQQTETGQRYGIIRFGSRADVYLPEGVAPLVAVGQTMIGGETVLGDCVGGASARTEVTR